MLVFIRGLRAKGKSDMGYTYPLLTRSADESIILADDTFDLGANECIMVDVGLVLDIGEDGCEIGIELINLKLLLGGGALDGTVWLDRRVDFSYDDESDSFYLRLSPVRRSVDQRTVNGFAILDIGRSLKGFKYLYNSRPGS